MIRFLPFVLVIGGIVSLVNYISAGNRSSSINELINNGVTTTAILDNEYNVVSNKSETYYETKYTFIVDGKTYEGERKTYEEPSEQIIEIKYLPNDPTTNGYDLEKERNELKSHEGDSFNLYAGIGATLVGLIWLFLKFAGGSKEKTA